MVKMLLLLHLCRGRELEFYSCLHVCLLFFFQKKKVHFKLKKKNEQKEEKTMFHKPFMQLGTSDVSCLALPSGL